MPLDQAWLEESFPDLSNLQQMQGGGQKWIFRADHPEYGEIVLKLFQPSPERRDVERALREARAGDELSSPFVPSVLESGTTDSPLGDLIWIYEEFVLGRSLRAVLAEEVEPHDVLVWGRTILEILAEAEESNIVHRDIKPGNVIIDDDGNAWLVDFGLARHLDLESITETEAARGVGTVGYSPPEQFLNLKGEIDARSDLFGLGVTLYECIEGFNPFLEGAESRNDVFRRILDRQLPPINEPVVESESFRNLLLAMTRREQEHRPRTVREAFDWMRDVCDEAGI